jgi:hypothetical protein
MAIKLPRNKYYEQVTECDALLGIYEELQTLSRVAVVVALFAVPLMILGIIVLVS